MPSARDRSRWLLIVAPAIAVLLWWWSAGARPSVAKEGARALAAASPAAPRARTQEARPALEPQLERAAARETVITIDDIVVEKESACRGEENLITVVAHAADPADDARLTIEVNGVAGDRVPLRTYGVDEPGTAPIRIVRQVVVRGPNGARADGVVPPLTVRDCEREAELLVSHEADPLRAGRVVFRAMLAASDSPPPGVVGYHWRFDDGTTADTAEPEVVHDYADRPQQSVVSTYLVSCTARLVTGGEVAGRDAVALENALFHATEGGPVAIVADGGDPTEDGSIIRQTLRLRHGAGEPVTLTRVTRLRHAWAQLGATPASIDVDPVRVLGTDEVPPEGLIVTLTLDASDGELVADEYLLEGTTADDRRARGRFFVRRPDVPPRLLSRLDRPAFREKLVRARQVLGKSHADERDVYELEHTHAFDDLGAEVP